MNRIGLRIDVDTFRGTRYGVPNLCRLMASRGIKGTFYFSVGPDNMGRHLWRLLKPQFLWKMLRTKAASLYGPEIILMGTMWPGPGIGKRLGGVIRDAFAAGHEIGLHTWDHHYWQSHIDRMTPGQMFELLRKGVDLLGEITGEAPTTSAVPGWKCTPQVLLEEQKFPFRYHSDCRGANLFMPTIPGQTLTHPQLPVTMPTYDEVLGRNGVTNDNYNDYMLKLLRPNQLNILTIHAEAEGNLCRQMFDEYVRRAQDMGYEFVMLQNLLPSDPNTLPRKAVVNRDFPGREGWLSCEEGWTPQP